jgi:UV DNA damage endonuclease
LIKEAYLQEAQEGRENNALLHIWGYFKNHATHEEKAVFEEKHSLWLNHQGSLLDLKKELYALSVKYDQVYLLNSTYFDSVR